MKILVIEDNIKTNNYIVTRLKTENFTVDAVHNGKEGLNLAKLYSYDLILLDLDLPSLKGIEIIKNIRQQKILTSIIVISANATTKEIPYLLEMGANDVISKPFTFEELLARIHAILRRQNPPHHKPLIYKNIKLDYTTSAIHIAENIIHLTRNEFICMELLLQNAPHPVSRQEIFTYVWNNDDYYSSNTVETHILNIRKKLSKNNIDIIKTNIGKGYFILT